LLPQKQERRIRIQINEQQLLSLLNRLRPLPHPQPSSLLLPQQERRIRIQINELHPPPNRPLFEVLLLLHPQWVAVKSLMLVPPNFIYGISYAALGYVLPL
jgi:hypothetical protein